MTRHSTIALPGLLLCFRAAAQRPTPEEQQRTLDAARDTAVHYSSKLPDFICTEQVERTNAIVPNLRVTTDRLTIQLTYFGQTEKQKLVAINGNPTTDPLSSLEGLITGGEFGSLQLGVFDTSSSADFKWKEATNLRQRPATIYTYRVARARSHYMLGARGPDGKMAAAPAGYRGEVVLDNQTNRVLRLTAQADDIPKESDIVLSTVEVDYDFVDVAGREHLLPSRSDSRMQRTNRRIGNVVTFTGYHKFEADSTIDFGTPKK